MAPILPKTLLALVGFAAAALAQTQVTVNLGTQYQEIDGFGVSQAFTRANEFKAMPPALRQQGLDYLFNTTTGAGLTIIRMRIGASTKPANNESFSILPTNPGGPNAARKYVWDGDDASQVWFTKEAQKYGVTRFIADSWSAPAYMKTNNNVNNGGYLCGVRSCSSGDWRVAFAEYLVQYVKFYREEGVKINYLGFLNEPDFTASYESMLSNGQEAAAFIPTLYKALQAASLEKEVAITCCDAMGWDTQKGITSAMLNAGMEQYLGLITSHSYTSDPRNTMNTGKLKVWQTEAADLNSRWCTTWYSNGGQCEGMTWANKIHTGIVSANLSGYIYWQGVEVNQYQAASYLVASDNKVVTPSGRLWAFAQWSRFIRPGARRVGTSGAPGSTGVAAFRNVDGSVVVVFTNNGGGAQNVRVGVNGAGFEKAEAWVTDNSRAVAAVSVTVNGAQATVGIPARSVLTVRLT